MKRICSLFLFFLLLTACSQPAVDAPTWQEQYDLGVRYLSEGNYEEAVIAFTAAIEIDPKRSDSYLRLADVYESLGNIEAARGALQDGYKATGDESFAERLELLHNSDDWSQYLTNDIISLEDFTIGGIPFYELSIEDATHLLPLYEDYMEDIFVIEDDAGQPFEKEYSVIFANGEVIKVVQEYGAETLQSLSYANWMSDSPIYIVTEAHGIALGDSTKNVLEKIGVSAAGAEIISAADCDLIVGINSGDFWIEEETVDEERIEGRITRCISLYHDDAWCDFIFEDNALIHVEVSLWAGDR